MVICLFYIGSVVVLHIFGKVKGASSTMTGGPAGGAGTGDESLWTTWMKHKKREARCGIFSYWPPLDTCSTTLTLRFAHMSSTLPSLPPQGKQCLGDLDQAEDLQQNEATRLASRSCLIQFFKLFHTFILFPNIFYFRPSSFFIYKILATYPLKLTRIQFPI